MSTDSLPDNAVHYRAQTASGRTLRFVVDLSAPRPRRELPVWTALEHHRCEGCPLDDNEELCPAAADLAPITRAVGTLPSVERVDVEVTQGGRTVRRSTDVQELLRGVLGLVLASGECPILATLRPLAHMHLPFATFEETLFRTVGLHLVRAFFEARAGRPADFALDGLRRHHEQLAVVNRGLARRLKTDAQSDAVVNGLVQLFSVGLLVSDEMEHGLDALRDVLER